MFSASTLRLVATAAALAVALAGLLPFEHVHADEHQQVVHRHVIAEGAGHHDDWHDDHTSVHSEHADARILTVSWVTTSSFSFAGLIPVTALIFAEPRSTPSTLIVGTTILPTHDPPLRFTSSPAPPAVV